MNFAHVKSAAIRTMFRTAAIVFFSFSSLFAADVSGTEAAWYRDLSSARNTAFQTLVPAAPVYTPAPVFGRYDYTGLPLYVFTETSRISPVLVQAINNANYTLDVALYNLQIDEAAQALVKARDRGVNVRVMIDYDHVFPNVGKEIKYLIDSGIDLKVMKGRGGSGSMHNKYAIFDGTALQMGSANWTVSAESFSYENIMFVYDTAIIRGYQDNFEWMWRQGRSPTDPASPAAKAGPVPADPNPSVPFNGVMFPKYVFSPRGGTEAAIVRAIDAASSSVEVAMFTLTSKPIMGAIFRAASRGLKVRIVLNVKSKFPFHNEVCATPIELRFLDGRTANGLMHNKFAVLDDRMLINGAFNWSDTAEQINAENTIFTVAPEYVAPYSQEYHKIFDMAWPMNPHKP